MFGVPLFKRDWSRVLRPNAWGSDQAAFPNGDVRCSAYCDELAFVRQRRRGRRQAGIVPSLSAQLLARITDDLLSAHPTCGWS